MVHVREMRKTQGVPQSRCRALRVGLSALLGDNWDNRGDAEHGDKGEGEAPNVEAPEDVALAEELHTAACSEVDEIDTVLLGRHPHLLWTRNEWRTVGRTPRRRREEVAVNMRSSETRGASAWHATKQKKQNLFRQRALLVAAMHQNVIGTRNDHWVWKGEEVRLKVPHKSKELTVFILNCGMEGVEASHGVLG